MVTLRNTPSRTHSHAQRCPVDHPVERMESNSGEISDVVLNDMAQFAFRTFQQCLEMFLNTPPAAKIPPPDFSFYRSTPEKNAVWERLDGCLTNSLNPATTGNVVTIDELRSRPKDPLKLLQRRQRGFRKGPAVIDIKNPYSGALHIAFLDELDELD